MGVNESSHSSDAKINTEEEPRKEDRLEVANKAETKKDSKSLFFPQAKGLKSDKEDQSSIDENSVVNDVEINAEDINVPWTQKSPKEGKLTHENIVEFYPYVEEGEGEDKRKQINQRSLQRVQAATENTRYKERNVNPNSKSQEPLFFGPLLQKNALMNVVNDTYKKDLDVKMNPLMKSIPDNNEEKKQDNDEEQPYGLGYGKNPRLKSIQEEDKKKRIKHESALQLNVTSFYDSNTSKLEEDNKEDDEASQW